MTIEILETRVVNDPAGQPTTHHADIIITSGPNSYLLGVGGLPLTGDLQAILDAREGELWTSAEAMGRAVPSGTQMQSGARAWFAANSGALALFDLSISELETEINNLVDALLPLATAANRTKQKRLLTGLAIAVRVLVKREGLG